MMNETQKQLICDKLKRVVENEHISNIDAGRHLGIPANYVSMMRNPALWEKTPAWSWEKANVWYNSGQKLSEYSVARAQSMAPIKTEVKQKLIEVIDILI